MEKSLSFNVALYLSLSPKKRKIIDQIFCNEKTNEACFIKGKSLCSEAKCGRDTRKRLKKDNRLMDGLLFQCSARYDKNGRQTTDRYKLNSSFKKGIAWVEISYGLNPKKEKHMKIISHIQNEEKCALPTPQNAPPLVKINLSRDLNLKSTPPNPLKHRVANADKPIKEYIHPKIDKIRISQADKVMLSKYPEAWIEWGLENTLWYRNQGNKIEKPTDFLWSQIRVAGKRMARRT